MLKSIDIRITRVSVPEEPWERNQMEIREDEEERLEGKNMDNFWKMKERLRTSRGECSEGMEES